LFPQSNDDTIIFEIIGIGLDNGNFTVILQFVVFDSPDPQVWKQRGRRVFDIYLQVA
jgi:hypothetical protein